MKTKTSKTVLWVRSLVLLPLLALLIYSFSSNKKVEKHISSDTSGINYTARSIDIEVLGNDTYKIDDMFATKETFISTINKLHQDITLEIRNRIINIHVNDQKMVSDEEVWFIYNSVIDYGFHRIVTYNQEIIREKGNKPFAIKSSKKQKDATKKQVAEYNTLAKKYNEQSENKRIIKLKDVKRLEYLYNVMNEKQKAKAEPFPNLPPPPPVTPETPKKMKEKELPPPPPIPNNITPEQKKKMQGAIIHYNKNVPPPPPKSPLDHVIELAKKGATFYYEDKKVSSDKAIELLKNNKNLNTSTNTINGVSIVKIHTEPVRS